LANWHVALIFSVSGGGVAHSLRFIPAVTPRSRSAAASNTAKATATTSSPANAMLFTANVFGSRVSGAGSSRAYNSVITWAYLAVYSASMIVLITC
jgi:hypothetical protein